MRPDAINWSEMKGGLSTVYLPKAQLHRTVWRWIVLLLALQAVFAAGVLSILESPLANASSPRGNAVIAALAGLTVSSVAADPSRLQTSLEALCTHPAIVYAVVLDGEGNVIARGNASDAWRGRVETSATQRSSLGGWIQALLASDRPTRYESALAPVAGAVGARFIIGVSDSASHKSLRSGLLAIGLSLLVSAIIMLPLARRELRAWTAGLHDLHAAIRGLAAGAMPKPVAVGGNAETGYLQLAFNDMAARIAASRKALEETNADLERRVATRTAELHIANTSLSQANRELEEVTDTALRFTDDVAHEFRTPLTVIMEYASMAADGLAGEVTDKQHEFLDCIVDASTEMAQLVDDFLDSGKLRARSLRVDRRPLDVDEIIKSSRQLLEPRAASRKVRLDWGIVDGLPQVFCDPDKARRTIVNLVMNAIKFSPSGGTVTIRADRDDDNRVQFRVSDQGRGLTPEEVRSLFTRFRQGIEGQRSACKGFGLGLNIVRDLVAINLGTVTVESTVGEGSTFAFDIPVSGLQAILDAYSTRLHSCTEPTEFAVFEIRFEPVLIDPSDAQSALDSVLRPLDLQLPGGDGTRVIITECQDATGWKRSLTAALDECTTRDGEGTDRALEIVHVGSWLAPAESSAILAAAMRSGTEVLNHEDSHSLGRR